MTGVALPAPSLFDLTTVKVKKLRDTAILPRYMREGDSCADVYAAEAMTIDPGCKAKVGLGLAFEFSEHLLLDVRSRSSIIKSDLVILTKTVDSNYRGEVFVAFRNLGTTSFHIGVGDRIAQIAFVPIVHAHFIETTELSATARGANGFGSSGK